MRIDRLVQTIILATKRGSIERGRYLKEKDIFSFVGENVHFQPRLVPLYPELIKLHNNIMISAGVRLITHDASFVVLNKLGIGRFPEKVGCIEIMNNVYVGYNATIMPNVRIGENVIVGAGTLVSKDLESNGVYVGVPARRICSFNDYVERNSPDLKKDGRYRYPYVSHNQHISDEEVENAWKAFNSRFE